MVFPDCVSLNDPLGLTTVEMLCCIRYKRVVGHCCDGLSGQLDVILEKTFLNKSTNKIVTCRTYENK